jgi:integrase
VADHEGRLPAGGTKARSVQAAFQLYQQAVDVGLVELAPRTRVTVRSAANTMSLITLADGRAFGEIRLSRLTWQDIEVLYAAMRASGHGAPWIRRCATVLNRTLELARKRGLLDANPAKNAARPRLTRTEPFALSGEEIRDLLARVRRVDPELADAVTVLASTGMRLGELLGL